MGVKTTIFRLVLNLVAISGSGMVIYGIVESRSGTRKALDLDDSSAGSVCLLRPKKNERSDLLAGSEVVCTATIVAAASSILQALNLMCCFISTLKEKSTNKHSCSLVVCQMVAVVIALFAAVVSGVTISASITDLCSMLETCSAVAGRAVSCSDLPIGKGDASAYHYYFYNDLSVSRIGAWVSVASWSLHVIFAAINCNEYHNNKGSADIPVRGLDNAMARVVSPPTVEVREDEDSFTGA